MLSRYTEGCPTCGALSDYGSDEDGYPTCLRCGGPYQCEECGEYVVDDPVDGQDWVSCESCGLRYHPECFPPAPDLTVCPSCAPRSEPA